MKTHVQIALTIAAFMYLLWGVGFIVKPEFTHSLISAGPYDVASIAILGAAIFGFSMLFRFAARNPSHDFLNCAAASLLFLGGVFGLMMILTDTVVVGLPTVISTILSIGIAVFLFISQNVPIPGLSSNNTTHTIDVDTVDEQIVITAPKTTKSKKKTKKVTKKKPKKKTKKKVKKKTKKKAKKRTR